MATISSPGIGSGLDVNSIVTQLVALEKAPLKGLAVKATNVQAQLSAFGQIQSQFSALSDVATRISDPLAWSARVASSSNSAAATITATAATSATSFSLDVDALALYQSTSSTTLAPGSAVGVGTLTFQAGSWSAGGTAFTAAASPSVAITTTAADTVATLAVKINATGAGVVASVFNDGINERLILRSKNTGTAAGFRIQSADVALAGLVFDPQNKPGAGMAAAGIPVQYGQDAKARINGLSVTSSTNTLSNNFAGVTITLAGTTTTGFGTPGEVRAPLTMAVREDVTPAVKNVQDFVAAYNKLNQSLADMTKYDAATKAAGLFQGDSSVVGLQNVLRNMVGSVSLGTTAQRLSDIGLERQRDGSLSINTNKLSAAANNGTTLQQLFTKDNNNSMTNGFALKFRDLGKGVLATGGAVVNKARALQSELNRNSSEQAKVNDRAAMVETRLRKQYSALDAKMASLTALNSYVAQQVTAWNNAKN